MEIEKQQKQQIRQRIWQAMVEKAVARPPFPITHRIPNFVGAEEAAKRLAQLEPWKSATVIKVNPDSPQHPVREAVIRQGKTLLMPTPRLRAGFLKLKPAWCLGKERQATTIKGMFKFGRPAQLEDLAEVGFVVAGSVAVNLKGVRIGKAGGYSDLEYAMLREAGAKEVRVATTVHELQILDEELPFEKNDVPVDFIATPERLIEIKRPLPKPKGIFLDLVTDKMILAMPILKEFLKRKKI